MNLTILAPSDAAYPRNLTFEPPPAIAVLGNQALLQSGPLGFFCSIRCPGAAILKTYDLARRWRDAGVAVIGGFHSPMEKECLTFLLRGTQPALVCPARGLQGMRLPADWRKAIADDRLLLLSPFTAKQKRATAELAEARNAFVATLADRIFVSYAAPGGKIERLCCE